MAGQHAVVWGQNASHAHRLLAQHQSSHFVQCADRNMPVSFIRTETVKAARAHS